MLKRSHQRSDNCNHSYNWSRDSTNSSTNCSKCTLSLCNCSRNFTECSDNTTNCCNKFTNYKNHRANSCCNTGKFQYCLLSFRVQVCELTNKFSKPLDKCPQMRDDMFRQGDCQRFQGTTKFLNVCCEIISHYFSSFFRNTTGVIHTCSNLIILFLRHIQQRQQTGHTFLTRQCCCIICFLLIS